MNQEEAAQWQARIRQAAQAFKVAVLAKPCDPKVVREKAQALAKLQAEQTAQRLQTVAAIAATLTEDSVANSNGPARDVTFPVHQFRQPCWGHERQRSFPGDGTRRRSRRPAARGEGHNEVRDAECETPSFASKPCPRSRPTVLERSICAFHAPAQHDQQPSLGSACHGCTVPALNRRTISHP